MKNNKQYLMQDCKQYQIQSGGNPNQKLNAVFLEKTWPRNSFDAPILKIFQENVDRC